MLALMPMMKSRRNWLNRDHCRCSEGELFRLFPSVTTQITLQSNDISQVNIVRCIVFNVMTANISPFRCSCHRLAMALSQIFGIHVPWIYIFKQGRSERFDTWQRICNLAHIDFSARVTLKYDGWPRKTIGNLFSAPRSYMCHLKPFVNANWKCTYIHIRQIRGTW